MYIYDSTHFPSTALAMSFVSAKELEAAKELRKEQKRASRDQILKEAKESFERDKRRQELKRQRGEDRWLAPGISERLGFGSEQASLESKTKKHKKRKKHKTKKSKHRREKDEDASSSASSDSETEEMWVEKTGESEPEIQSSQETLCKDEDSRSGTLKREDWMTMSLGPSARSMAVLTGRREAKDKEEEEKKKVCLLAYFLNLNHGPINPQ